MIFMNEANPGNGKTYIASITFIMLLRRNITWFRKGKIKRIRPIATNIAIHKDLVEKYSEYIIVWENLSELIDLRECDVIFDDMGSYLDSQRWADVPVSVKRWFRLHEHYGVDIYANAQNFSDVVGAVRKLTVSLTRTFKIIGSKRPAETKPPVKRIWGLFVTRTVNIADFEKDLDSRTYTDWFGAWRPLRKKYCAVFDTLQDLVVSDFPDLEYIERKCVDKRCPKYPHIIGKHV